MSSEYARPNLNLKKSLVATVAVSAGVNAALYGIGGKDALPTIQNCDEPVATTVTRSRTYPVGKPYSREFSDGPMVTVTTDPQAADNLIAKIIARRDQGETIDEVRVKGYASGDDNTENSSGERTGGYRETEPSTRNEELAADRATSFVDSQYQKRLRDAGFNVPIVYEQPEEVHLTDPQIQQLDDLSVKYGFPSAPVLEDTYDGIIAGDVPEEARRYLDAVIGANRRVDVTVNSHKTTTTQDCDEIPVPLILPIPVFEARELPPLAPLAGPRAMKIMYPPAHTPGINTEGHAQTAKIHKQPRPRSEGKQRDRHLDRDRGGSIGLSKNRKVPRNKRGQSKE